jgi:hypothetical protein
MTAYKKAFELEGQHLLPGNYLVEREGDHILKIKEAVSGNLAGRINALFVFQSNPEFNEYPHLQIVGFAVYNSGNSFEGDSGIKDSRDLMHIAVTYDQKGWSGGDWKDATPTDKTAVNDVIVFNKDLSAYLSKPELFNDVVRRSNCRPNPNYYLENIL